jgi:type IV secretory pathway TraG/TraD family ATPase VirD4
VAAQACISTAASSGSHKTFTFVMIDDLFWTISVLTSPSAQTFTATISWLKRRTAQTSLTSTTLAVYYSTVVPVALL